MKASFDRAIGPVPAPGFDLDAVIRRGRRHDRLRRVSISGAAAATTTVVVLAVVALVAPRTDARVRTDTGSAVRAPQPASGAPSRPVISAKAQEQRLRGVVMQLLSRYAPGVSYVDVATTRLSTEPYLQAHYDVPKAVPDAGGPPLAVTNESFEATALLKDRAGISWFRVLVFDFYPENFAYSCLPKEAACTILTAADGSRIYRRSEVRVDHGPRRRLNVVAVRKADGSVAEVQSNTDLATRYGTIGPVGGKRPEKAGAARATPQFDTDQLTAIAADPRLVLFP